MLSQTTDALTALGIPHVVEDRHRPNRLRYVRVTGGLH